MYTKKLLNIPVKTGTKNNILEKIKKYIDNPGSMFHIVSLNPETIVTAYDDKTFRKILSEGDIHLIDGVGVALGCALYDIQPIERITGVDFIEILLECVKDKGLHILLIGGRGDLAEDLAVCYSKMYPQLQFKGVPGFKDINQPTTEEIGSFKALTSDYNPDIVFAAFGSPDQEKLFDRHKRILDETICMGVGGSFDFISGNISRAPVMIRQIGLEWLYRLIREPWRWRRQMRLVRFIYLVSLQRIGLY